MKTNRNKTNWIIDALLFTGFLISFALDLTGLPVHQWLGIFGGLLGLYHLVLHWGWVKAVTRRLFGKTSAQAQIYYLFDTAILLGFSLILATGLLISTWLGLALVNYAAWKDFHVTASIATLCLVVLKIGLHWRWIVRVARKGIFRPAPRPTLGLNPLPAPQPIPARALTSDVMTRRDFLKLMSVVGVASLAAISVTLNGNLTALASSTASESLQSNSSQIDSDVTDGTDAHTQTQSDTVTVTQVSGSSTTTTTSTTSCTVQYINTANPLDTAVALSIQTGAATATGVIAFSINPRLLRKTSNMLY